MRMHGDRAKSRRKNKVKCRDGREDLPSLFMEKFFALDIYPMGVYYGYVTGIHRQSNFRRRSCDREADVRFFARIHKIM